jgi:arsenite methyltransferase
VRMEAHAFASAELSGDAYGSALLPLMQDYVAGVERIGEETARAWVAEQHELQKRGRFFFACMQFCFTGVRAA